MIPPVHKRLIIFFVSLFVFFMAKAGDTLYYAGNIIISPKVSYKYILRFTISAKNEITGYSLTDAGGANETKVKISGSYDSLKKTLSFEEKNILRTKVDQNQTDLCFVKATLTYKYTNFLETFSGKFSGFKPGTGDICASGEIKLINARKGQTLRRKIDSVMLQNQEKEANKPPAQIKKQPIEVSDAKGISLPFIGDTARITIWDNGKIDGDRISVMLNDTYLVTDYTLDSVKKIITAPLTSRPVDTIKVIALNEGKIPPNTAMIIIESSTETYPIEVRAPIHEVRKIYLQKKKLSADQ